LRQSNSAIALVTTGNISFLYNSPAPNLDIERADDLQYASTSKEIILS